MRVIASKFGTIFYSIFFGIWIWALSGNPLGVFEGGKITIWDVVLGLILMIYMAVAAGCLLCAIASSRIISISEEGIGVRWIFWKILIPWEEIKEVGTGFSFLYEIYQYWFRGKNVIYFSTKKLPNGNSKEERDKKDFEIISNAVIHVILPKKKDWVLTIGYSKKRMAYINSLKAVKEMRLKQLEAWEESNWKE